MAPASVGCQAAQMEEPRDTPLSLPRSAPGRVPPQESQPLTCHCGPSLLLSVALPPAGARGGRAALPAWGFRAFVLCRPPWVSSVYSRRDRKSLQAWLLARGNCPRPGAQRTGLSSPISLGGGQVLGTPTCGRASSYKTCSRSPAWGRQGVRGPLPVSPWCNCKYQDCSLQIPGPSPNPSL